MRIDRWKGGGAPDEATLRRQLESEGYSVLTWTDPAGETYPPHAHGDDQTHWVLRGTLTISIAQGDAAKTAESAGEEYTISPGDRDYLPAGTLHSARAGDAEPVTYLVGKKAPADAH